jgi:hypothetical protein
MTMRIKHAATLLFTTTVLVSTVGATPSSDAAALKRQPGCERTFDVVDVEATPITARRAFSTFPADLSVVSNEHVWFGYDMSYQSWPLRWDGGSVESAPLVPRPSTAAGMSFWFSNTAPILAGSQIVSFDSAEHGWLLTNVSALGNPNSSGVPVGYRWHEGRWTMTPLAASTEPRRYLPNPAEVESLSPSDAWLVGGMWYPSLTGGETGYHGALIQHWDGTSWQNVDNPLSNERHVSLWAMAAVSPTDIWAVGGRYYFDDPIEPVVMHWDGGEWSVVPTPAPSGSILHSVSAAGSDDVWAVGMQSAGSPPAPAPLLMRWDGTEWTVVADFPGSRVDDVYAADATDVWVSDGSELRNWDGSTWHTVATPGPELYGLTQTIDALDGSGPDNIWVAGRSMYGEETYSPVIYRLSCDRPGGGSR